MENKEIGWINIVKAICMIMVYFYHTSVYCGYEPRLFSFYSPFFVTSFFFISGYLIFKLFATSDTQLKCEPQPVGGVKIDNVLYKIAIPTVLFSLINYFPKVIIRGVGISFYTFLCDTILGGSLWFTSALVISEVILYVLFKTQNKNIAFYSIITVCLAVCAIILEKQTNITLLNNRNIPWFYKAGMIGSFYMVLGGMYRTNENRLNIKLPMLISLCVVYCLLVFTYGERIHIAVNVADVNILGFIMSLLGIYILISICKRVKPLEIVNYLGRNTLPFYFLSGGVPNVLSMLYIKLGYTINIYSYIVLCILSLLLAGISVTIIKKYAFFLLDLRILNKNNN